MKRIRVAILGQGRSGRDIHGAYLIHDRRRYEIVAAVDPLADRRRRAAKEFKCEVFADHRPLLKRDDLDLVINATPSDLHVPVSLAFLRAGFNVLCEKPLARRARDVDRLIAAARKARKVLAIYQQGRFAPYFQQVRKVIASGVLGRIVQVSIASAGFSRRWDWQTLQERHGGSLLNTGPHLMDQALQLFGTNTMPEVTCYMDRATTLGDAEDHVLVTLRGKGRPFVTVEITSCCAYPKLSYRVYGTRGGLAGNASHIDWKHYKPREAPPQRLTRKPTCQSDGTPAYCREKLKWHSASWDVPAKKRDLFGSMAAAFYRALYKTLTARAALVVKPKEVRQQIAVIEKCHELNPQITRKVRR
jgi:predicted dehydrogenase